MQARLTIINRKDSTSFILNREQKTIIGRHPDCNIQFPEIKISAKHCSIESEGEYFFIIDLASSNGTYVNGTRIKHRKLYNEDIIKIGDIELKFEWIDEDESEEDITAVDLDAIEAPEENKQEEKYEKMGKYIVHEKIGQGGIGEVYKAECIHSRGIWVAIKILKPISLENETLVKRFIREAEACISLNHPRIVKVFELENHKGRPYFIMEYIKGEPLNKFIKEKGAFSIINSLKIAGHIAHALDYAHKNNIIHRDLKPGNILVDEKDYHVKLIDLGLAKMLERSQLTIDHHIVGTPRYMAPEQMINATEIDERADIYSLGATLYHLVTGIPPYSEIIATKKSALLRYIYSNEPIPIEQLKENIPIEVIALIKKAMAKNKEDRYSSAKEMFEALYNTIKKIRK